MSILLVLAKDARWTDPWGREHSDAKALIDVVEVVPHPEGLTIVHDNGYYKTDEQVYVEAGMASMGRQWLAIPPIDFGASTGYRYLPGENEQPDPGYVWWQRYHPTMRLLRPTLGRLIIPITTEEQLRRFL